MTPPPQAPVRDGAGPVPAGPAPSRGAAVLRGPPAAFRLPPRWFLAVAPALVLLLLGCLWEIDVPGLYMDAVNPDYMVVRLLNPGHEVPVWVMPGTMLFATFPLLGQIYHGVLPYYIGLPVYALFGTGLLGVRLANFVFAALVLAGTGFFLASFRVGRTATVLCLCAAALDPGFLFSFRTQFYITCLPCALLFASIGLVERRRDSPGRGLAFAAGLLAGLCVYGYFIYLFLAPVAAAHAWSRWRARGDRLGLALRWLAGGLLGGLPFLLGALLLLVSQGGPAGFVAFMRTYLGALLPSGSGLSAAGRLGYAATLLRFTMEEVGPVVMMLHKAPDPLFPGLRLALLLGLPGCALLLRLLASGRGSGPGAGVSPAILVIAGMLCGFVLLVEAFGDHIWLHHAAFVLPAAYAALAIAVDALARPAGRRAPLVAAACVAPLLFGNAVDRQSVMFDLHRTGGVGLASDAIVRFAQDALLPGPPTHAFFPDWGVFMSFEMITRGRIPLDPGFTPEAARAVLCAGQDALVAVIDGPGPDRVADWTARIGWGAPDATAYRQRDGAPVLTALRWHAASPGHPPC